MSIYLTIITTVLVITQIIRITQNHVQLYRQEKQIEKEISWIKDNDISERDLQTQRECYILLKKYLKDRLDEQEKV